MLNLKKLFQVTTEERLIKYYIQSYEFLLKRIFPSCTAAAGHRVDQTFTILDLNGVSLSMVGKQVYHFIQLASKIGQDNYPEILGKYFKRQNHTKRINYFYLECILLMLL